MHVRRGQGEAEVVVLGKVSLHLNTEALRPWIKKRYDPSGHLVAVEVGALTLGVGPVRLGDSAAEAGDATVDLLRVERVRAAVVRAARAVGWPGGSDRLRDDVAAVSNETGLSEKIGIAKIQSK